MKKEKEKIRYGTHEWLQLRRKEIIKQEAQFNYKDRLKVYLSFSIQELEEMGHPLYKVIKKAFPTIDKSLTLDDARLTKLFESAISLGSIKALELTYKLDGSMSDLSNEPDYETISDETEGIK